MFLGMRGGDAVTTVFDLAGFVTVLVLLVVSARHRPRGDDEYLVADRRLTLFPLVATLVMTEFNTSTLVAFTAAGYRAGPMALALPLVFLVGLLFYTVTVAKAWKRFDRLSVAELFAERYSPALGRVASVLLLAAMTGFGATYVKSMALLFAPFVPDVPQAVVGGALTVVVLAVTLPGGLVSVVRSDIVGFLLTVLLVPALLSAGYMASGPVGGLASVFHTSQLTVSPIDQWQHPALPFRFVLSLMALTCVTYIAAPWYGQKSSQPATRRRRFVPSRWPQCWCSRSTVGCRWPPPTCASSGPTWPIRNSPCPSWSACGSRPVCVARASPCCSRRR